MIIYKTTNLINGKIYVGQDSKNNPNYLGSGIIFLKAIKKYHKENFKKEILEYCSTKEELNEREIFWIKKLKSQDKNIGYNIANGGFGCLGYKHTKKELEKISRGNKGKKISEETRKKMSISSKKECLSEETRKKMSISSKGKYHTLITKKKLGIPILQYSKDGKFINEFYSISEASRITKIQRVNINKVCRYKGTAGGFIWKYKNAAKYFNNRNKSKFNQ